MRSVHWRVALVQTVLALTVAGFVQALTDRIWLSGATALAVLAGPSFFRWRVQRAEIAALRRQLPELMLLLAAGLRCGAGLWPTLLSAAEQLPAPVRDDLVILLAQQRLGVSFAHALEQLQSRRALPEVTLLAATLRIAHDTGGSCASALEAQAESSRRSLALQGKLRALTAQGRLQGWVMAGLPMVLAAVIWQIEPRMMQQLLHTPAGQAVCALIGLLEALGGFWLMRILDVDL
jgi:tight adherence protein B